MISDRELLNVYMKSSEGLMKNPNLYIEFYDAPAATIETGNPIGLLLALTYTV